MSVQRRTRTAGTRALALTAGLAVTFAATLGACGTTPAPAGKLTVVAAFYPLQFLSERIGGDRVTVTNLVRAGAEPHDLELTPRQVADLTRADVVVYLRGFQPAVDAAVDQGAHARAFDAAAVGPLRDSPPGAGESDGTVARANKGKDPHVWLDPTRLAVISEQLAKRLAERDPGHAAEYSSRDEALRAELSGVDQEYAVGLAQCQRRDIVTSHAAFGYLAERYQLTQVPITGLSPEEEPTPAHLTEITTYARAHGVTTIFFETLVSPKLAETLAREVGAQAKVLDPVEGIEAGSGADYLSVMRTNLTTLRSALGCT